MGLIAVVYTLLKASNLCCTGGADNSKNKPLMGISPRTMTSNFRLDLSQLNPKALRMGAYALLEAKAQLPSPPM